MQFVFLLIRSISLLAIFIVVPVKHNTIYYFFCLHVLLTRVSLLALAKSIYYIFVIYSNHHFHTYVHCTWIIFLLFISQSNTCHIQLNVLLWLKWKNSHWYTLWLVRFDRLYQHSQSGSFLSLRKMACGVDAREIEEFTITSLLNEWLRDFPHIGALRKEQKTCLVNLARGKNVIAILITKWQ